MPTKHNSGTQKRKHMKNTHQRNISTKTLVNRNIINSSHQPVTTAPNLGLFHSHHILPLPARPTHSNGPSSPPSTPAAAAANTRVLRVPGGVSPEPPSFHWSRNSQVSRAAASQVRCVRGPGASGQCADLGVPCVGVAFFVVLCGRLSWIMFFCESVRARMRGSAVVRLFFFLPSLASL